MNRQSEEQIEILARSATQCRECFDRDEVAAPFINVAQPRWVGPNYWRSPFRITILLLNPGQSGVTPRAEAFLGRIRAFRDGDSTLRAVIGHQREGMTLWGNPPGRFTGFYIDGLGLDLDEIAFVNVAWCATAKNRYPRTMLNRCFHRHTAPLLQLLQPGALLASGGHTHRFARQIGPSWPRTKVIEMMHYAHREGRASEQKELARVRAVLAKARADYV